jgi:hypothetical protein
LGSLPEQWYCSMNLWDPLRNTCEAPEEEDVDENDAPLSSSSLSSLSMGIVASSTGPEPLLPTLSKGHGLPMRRRIVPIAKYSADGKLVKTFPSVIAAAGMGVSKMKRYVGILVRQ